jgi:hypothetical protein
MQRGAKYILASLLAGWLAASPTFAGVSDTWYHIKVKLAVTLDNEPKSFKAGNADVISEAGEDPDTSFLVADIETGDILIVNQCGFILQVFAQVQEECGVGSSVETKSGSKETSVSVLKFSAFGSSETNGFSCCDASLQFDGLTLKKFKAKCMMVICEDGDFVAKGSFSIGKQFIPAGGCV